VGAKKIPGEKFSMDNTLQGNPGQFVERKGSGGGLGEEFELA